MERFSGIKSWAAAVIFVFFLAGCAAPQGQTSGPVSRPAESAVETSIPETSDQESISGGSELSSETGREEKPAAGDKKDEENSAVSSAPAAGSSMPQSSTPAASSAVPQSSVSAAGSSVPQSSTPAAGSSVPQSSTPVASSSMPQSSTPAASSSMPQSSTPAASENGSPSSASVPTEESDLMQMARQVIDLVNQERARQGLSALRVNTELMEGAQIRSREIVTKFSHERPNGEQGYQLAFRAGFSTVGENIAYGYSSAEAVMEAWMNSSGHRANILGAGFTEIGVGCYRGSNGLLYWTQLFGG